MPVIGGAVAGGIIAVVVASGSSTTKSVTTTVTTQAKQAALPASFSKASGQSVNQIYKSASPGVVDIIVTTQSQSPTAQLFGGGGSATQKSQGEGAGVVYNAQGYILTDEHVVSRSDLGEGQLPGRQELSGQGDRDRPVDRRRRDQGLGAEL